MKKFVQKVPATVWKSVYKDYLNDMRLKAEAATEKIDEAKLPGERTLQDALRAALNEIGTGVSDDAAAKEGHATMQSEDLLVKLRRSDTFNWRKMCEFRGSLLTGESDPAAVASSGNNASTNDVSTGEDKFRNRTKKDILSDAANSMSEMVAAVEKGTTDLCHAVNTQTAHL